MDRGPHHWVRVNAGNIGALRQFIDEFAIRRNFDGVDDVERLVSDSAFLQQLAQRSLGAFSYRAQAFESETAFFDFRGETGGRPQVRLLP